MPKHFISLTGSTADAGSRITITGDAVHHFIHVLRIKPGFQAIFCDGANIDYTAVYITSDTKTLTCTFEIIEKTLCTTEPPFFITVYQGLPKGDKFESVIQKCVELGASRIVPVYTAHAMIKNAEKKHPRYQKIAEAAAGQSMRGIIPEVVIPLEFTQVFLQVFSQELTQASMQTTKQGYHLKSLSSSEMDCHLVALSPSEIPCGMSDQAHSLRRFLHSEPPQRINIWIGPEGGFSKEEVTALLSAGGQIVSLCPRVLRTETAAPALLSQISLLWEYR
jgi:16S rRNA (uracil1498-N3)-methyltransferase